MIHRLKISTRFFYAVAFGSKTFEIRKYDRPYKMGDTLELWEADDKGKPTNWCVTVTVTYVLEKYEGIEKGFVILGIQNPSEIYPEVLQA